MQKLVEGRLVAGSNCLVVEDVITTGSSVLETVRVLQDVGVGVTHAIVLLDREQGGRGNIQQEGVAVRSVMTLSRLMGFLLDAGMVTSETVATVRTFLADNSTTPLPSHTPKTSPSTVRMMPM